MVTIAKKIKSLDEVPVDVVEAVKRAFIWKGFIPRKYRRNSPIGIETHSKSQPDKQDSSNSSPKQETEASYETGEVESQEIHEKLIDLTEKAHECLFEADTVFPFTLFPDTITVDREKLTVATRSFFRTAKILSVPLSSILSAEADVGPFFGSIHLTSKYFVQNKYSVNFLTRKDASDLHHLLHGYIIAHERDIDITDVDKDDLIVLLKDLGQGVDD